jgi:dihydrodipicolinate synthase/N-acetylneuraminate lyase
MAHDIAGVWATLLLPLSDTDEIRWEDLSIQLDRLLTSGVAGVYAHGTAGEFHTLNEREFDAVSALLAKGCEGAGVAFQIGASHPAAPVMLERVARAVALAPGAIQVVLPDWLPMRTEEAVRFLTRAAEIAAPVPLVLYNPPHAKTRVTPAVLARITAEVPSVVGFKSAGGDAAWFAAMAEAAPGVSSFVPGHLMASGLWRGARGSYSNVAALSPSGAAAWYELTRRDQAAGLDIERRIAELFARHIAPLQAAGISDPALDKFLAAVGGWAPVGLRTRWPATPAPPEAVAPARDDAQALLPELVAS